MDVDVDLRLKGKMVTRCCVDTGFVLVFHENKFHTEVRIGGHMEIEHNGQSLSLSGEKPNQAGQACILMGRTVDAAIGHKDGSLNINFTDGSIVTVPVDPHYEAWEASAHDGFMVVSRPGGGLAIWGPKSP